MIIKNFIDKKKIPSNAVDFHPGDHEQAINNRPISLLPVLSKVCERAAYNQLTSYLLEKERLTQQQSGNKKWHSTETSVIQTTDAILNAIDKKKLTE